MTSGVESAVDHLDLADWRRRISDLYAQVRATSASDPEAAWEHWRQTREELFREHPQSPVPAADRREFTARHWPYDPALRFELEVESAEQESGPATGKDDDAPTGIASESGNAGRQAFGAERGNAPPRGFGSLLLPVSDGGEQSFARVGSIEVPFAAGPRRLGLFWMAGYAGGLFLPFRDATNGTETYGAGRYLLDAAKSADLGGNGDQRTLVLDFNFAFQPSCSFDPRWSCPLSPPENRLDLRVEAGERLN
jgi:uncharacterized protein (DUF1684 family)